MLKKLFYIVSIHIFTTQCIAQVDYNNCYAKYDKIRDSIIEEFHYYQNKRKDSTITEREEIEFDKIRFKLFISNFLDWGEKGFVKVNTDPFYKYYDSMTSILKHFDELEFDKRPDVAEKLKKRKPDSVYIKKEYFSIPKEIAKNTRFGNLEIGKSLDLYYLKPIVVFYDTAWEQSINFETGEGISKYPRGYRSFCECKDDPLKSSYGEFYPSEYGQFDDCQWNMFKFRLASVYDILKEDMDRIAVKGKDMRYNMFRRITITREECYYTVQYYKDIFEPDSQNQMLIWYSNKYKNNNKNTFMPHWEKAYLLKTTLTKNPMAMSYSYPQWLDYYSHKLCQLEEGKIGAKRLYLSKKFQNTPHLSSMWDNGVFMDTWQIMDFGDDKPVCRRFTGDGDYIMYRNPLNTTYYEMSYNYYYEGNDARPYYKSYNKRRRFLYYSILRYPDSSIRRRIDYVTHQ